MKATTFATFLIAFSGCALDEMDDDPDLGTTSQEIVLVDTLAWGTTTDVVGLDTGLSRHDFVCVLNGVGGDLTDGAGTTLDADPSTGSIHSTASVVQWNAAGNILLKGHGGRFGGSNWTNNPVMAGASCIAGRASATGVWKTNVHHRNNPKLVAGLAPNRRCFLSGIYTTDGMFNRWEDSAAVRQITSTTTDFWHPNPGWYIESTLIAKHASEHGFIYATCIDFPTITGDWGGAFGGDTNTMTTGTGVKFCGLQGIYGAFGGGFKEGAFLNPPTTQTGNWTMTVTDWKYAAAECIQ